MDDRTAAIAGAVLLIVMVLLALVALWARHGGAVAAVVGGGVGGGDEARHVRAAHGPHVLGAAVHQYRRALGPEDRVPHFVAAPAGPETRGGAPPKHWTEFPTWAALKRDPAATAQYNRDKRRALAGLKLDWSGVAAELAAIVEEPREWAGLINLVDGKPRIVEKRAGPAADEADLPEGAAAVIPSELVEAICRRPALFFFHTHPPQGLQAVPSPTDLAMAETVAYTNRYAADVIVSAKGVVMYRPDRAITAEYEALAEAGRRKAARLLYLRRSADVLATFAAFRSRRDPWRIRDYAMVARKMGIDFVEFPSWRGAHDAARLAFSFEDDRDPADVVEAYELELDLA